MIKMTSYKQVLSFSTVLVSAALMGSIVSNAQAQTAPDASVAPPKERDVIVVTGARQRQESAKDVPLAVQNFSAVQIKDAGIDRPADFIALTPNVSFIQTTNVGESQVHIRGVIQPRDTEPPFAYVLDGVLVPNPNAFNQELSDIASIEVIKGPIGSIYGRNAIGGAILVNTMKPRNQFEGQINAGYEIEGQEYKLGGFISGPLASNVYGRITAHISDRKGYFDNITRNTKEDPFQEQVLRGRLIIDASESVEFDLQAGWGHIDGYAFAFNNQLSFTPGFTQGVNTGDTSLPFAGNLASFNKQDRWNLSAKMTWDVADGVLSAFVAHNALDENMGGEGAADLALFGLLGPPSPVNPSPTDFFTNPALYEGYGPTDRDGSQYQERNQEDTSAEIRFTSDGQARFRYIVGAYVISFQRDILLLTGDVGFGTSIRQAPVLVNGAAGTQGTGGNNDNSAWAIFGQAAYDITPKLEASLALRYDKEERENTNTVTGPVALIGVKRKNNFDQVQPRISFRYKANDAISLYGTYGEGFRSGGFNALGSRNAILTIDGKTNTTVRDDFPKETSKSFELGFKSILLDRRLSLNGALFSTKVENAHFFQFFPFSLARVISIVQENEITGGEFDFNFLLDDNWKFFGGAGILNSKIGKNDEVPASIGKDFPFTPDHSLVLGVQYDRSISSNLDLVTRLEWNQTGKMWFDTENTKGTERPQLDLVNARIAISGDNWTASLWSRNLFDKKYNVDAVVLNVPPPAGLTFNFVTKGTPRTIGAELSFKF
ncbi:TonB-dependent receptor [Candidatus Phycosocius spiralis]|nr:TonB-dependent receptor [Candidatus Phycosocius spiralis]